MSLKQRRLLFYSFLFLFILVAPFAILYATGRTINWQRLEIQKTGSMIIESEPGHADIFLNNRRPVLFLHKLFGRAVPPRTGARLTNLAPGTYIVRLELPGYLSWEEKVTVRANEVTHVGPVQLFKHTAPVLTTSFPLASVWSVSPDHTSLLVQNQDSINFIKIAEARQIPLTLPISTLAVRWSTDSLKALVNERLILNNQGVVVFDLQELKTYHPTFVRWDNENSDNLYFVDNQILYRFTLSTEQVSRVLDLKPLLPGRLLFDYRPTGDHAYLALKTNQQAELLTLSLNTPTRQHTVTLPTGKYQFLTDSTGNNLLLETVQKNLYVIDQPLPLFLTPRLTLVAQPYAMGRWADSTLLYASPLEVRQWSNNQERLLARFGEPLVDLVLLPQRQTMLLASKQMITVRPTSDRPFMQTTTLATVDELRSLLNVNNNLLYFVGRVGTEEGVFKLEY